MSFKLKYIPLTFFVAVNILCVAAMNLSAYSSWLPPQTYPDYSYFGLLFPVFLVANVLFVFFWLTFKRWFVLLPLLGMLCCGWAIRTYMPFNINKDAPADALKVMSYNVMMFEGADKDVPWQDKPIVRYIIDSGADIVCLQETGWMDKAIQYRNLDMLSYPYKSLYTAKNIGLACLSKYPIINARKIDYESRSNCSFAYDILIGKDTILLVNNHFESYKLSQQDKDDYKELINATKDTKAEQMYEALTDKLIAANKIRGPQADSVAAFVNANLDRYSHVIVCGDFNDSPLSYTHHALTRHLNDAYTRAGNGPGLSYNRSGMYFRLDHILVSENIVPYRTVVDKSIKSSDHYPVVSELGL